jgi:hypothetical protein
MNSISLEDDKNPYNDKETEDMLRHFKLEYFLMTNALSFIFTEAILINGNFYNLKCRGTIPANANLILWCCLIPRALRYLYYAISLEKGN